MEIIISMANFVAFYMQNIVCNHSCRIEVIIELYRT